MNSLPSAKLSVLLVLPHLESGDFKRRRVERINRERAIVDWIRKTGAECHLCSLSFESDDLSGNNPTRELNFKVLRSGRETRFSYISPSLLCYVQEKRPDIIVFKGIGYRLARYLLTKSHVSFRLVFIAAGSIHDPALPYADYVFAETQMQLEYFERYLPRPRISILPKLNPNINTPSSLEKTFDIVNVGTFNSNKNQAALLPLANHYRLALLGDGEFWETVNLQAANCFFPVFMPGNLPRDEVSRIIAKSRLMVHAAHKEGLPRVVMEAFAVGVPVVASRRAMPGAFDHDVQGWLVGEGRLLAAARDLLGNPVRLAEMGKAAREYAVKQCSENAVFDAISLMTACIFSSPPRYQRYWWQNAHVLARLIYLTAALQLRQLLASIGAKWVLRKIYRAISVQIQ